MMKMIGIKVVMLMISPRGIVIGATPFMVGITATAYGLERTVMSSVLVVMVVIVVVVLVTNAPLHRVALGCASANGGEIPVRALPAFPAREDAVPSWELPIRSGHVDEGRFVPAAPAETVLASRCSDDRTAPTNRSAGVGYRISVAVATVPCGRIWIRAITGNAGLETIPSSVPVEAEPRNQLFDRACIQHQPLILPAQMPSLHSAKLACLPGDAGTVLEEDWIGSDDP
jgi:hypothetical protein